MTKNWSRRMTRSVKSWMAGCLPSCRGAPLARQQLLVHCLWVGCCCCTAVNNAAAFCGVRYVQEALKVLGVRLLLALRVLAFAVCLPLYCLTPRRQIQTPNSKRVLLVCRKLFQDDAAVKNGVLQVFVRMKPVSDTTDTCMVLDPNHLLKATWCVPTPLQLLQLSADMSRGKPHAGA